MPDCIYCHKPMQIQYGHWWLCACTNQELILSLFRKINQFDALSEGRKRLEEFRMQRG